MLDLFANGKLGPQLSYCHCLWFSDKRPPHLMVSTISTGDVRLSDSLIVALNFIPWGVVFYPYRIPSRCLFVMAHGVNMRREQPRHFFLCTFLLILGGTHLSATSFQSVSAQRIISICHFFFQLVLTSLHPHSVWSSGWCMRWSLQFCTSSSTPSPSPAASQRNCARTQASRRRSDGKWNL